MGECKIIEISGKYDKAKVFANNIDKKAQSQIVELCDQPAFEGSKIRIMPDVHAGKGCVIGFTIWERKLSRTSSA